MFSATAMPSSSALCASIGPGTTSPIAQMPGTAVRKSWSISTWPLALAASPALSSASPSVLGRRPIATSTASASIVSGDPPAAASTAIVAASPATVTPVTLVDELELDALLLEELVGFLADLAVHAGQDLVEIFDHGHLGAEPLPHRAELEPDHAAADHDEVLRAPWAARARRSSRRRPSGRSRRRAAGSPTSRWR